MTNFIQIALNNMAKQEDIKESAKELQGFKVNEVIETIKVNDKVVVDYKGTTYKGKVTKVIGNNIYVQVGNNKENVYKFLDGFQYIDIIKPISLATLMKEFKRVQRVDKIQIDSLQVCLIENSNDWKDKPISYSVGVDLYYSDKFSVWKELESFYLLETYDEKLAHEYAKRFESTLKRNYGKVKPYYVHDVDET